VYCSVIQRFEAMAGEAKELLEIFGEIRFFRCDSETIFSRSLRVAGAVSGRL